MTDQEDAKFEINVGDVVCWDENKEIGIIQEIRVIDKAEFLQRFSGLPEKVILRIHTQLGIARVWPYQHEVVRVSAHEAKEYKARIKQSVSK